MARAVNSHIVMFPLITRVSRIQTSPYIHNLRGDIIATIPSSRHNIYFDISLQHKRYRTCSNSVTEILPKKLIGANLCSSLAFVPKHEPCSNESKSLLQDFVQKATKIFIVTGAGISTESGIPDYRSEGVGLYATSLKRPVQIKDYISNFKARQSYWARNFVGWPRFSSFQPNATHLTLALWERQEKVSHIVTQNVDTLHQKAGSKKVTELHGSAHEVQCMKCDYSISRHAFQSTLTLLNPHMTAVSQEIRPDGDVELSLENVSRFTVPPCPDCGGLLKPFVVFFGDNVPKARVDAVRQELSKCDALLALGTSLQVFSAYRFILQAAEWNIPMAAVNIGPTRADQHLAFRVVDRCGHLLPLIKL